MKHCKKEFRYANRKILEYKYGQSMHVNHDNNIIIKIVPLEQVI